MADSLSTRPWRPACAACRRPAMAVRLCTIPPFSLQAHVLRVHTIFGAQNIHKWRETPENRPFPVLCPALRTFHKRHTSHRVPRCHKPPLGMYPAAAAAGLPGFGGHTAQTATTPPRKPQPFHTVTNPDYIRLRATSALLFLLLFPRSPCRSTSHTNPAAPVMRTGC